MNTLLTTHPRGWLPILCCLAALAAPIVAAAGRTDGSEPPVYPAPAGLREDAIVVRLGATAARFARAAAATSPGQRHHALGVAALDRAAAALGGATFEAEFPAAPSAPASRVAPSARLRSAAEALSAFYVVHLPPGCNRDAALSTFRALPEVAAADPIALMPVEAVPDDSLWSKAWHLWQPSRRDVHAPEAWDRARGDSSIVVGIVDTGVLLDHPDLRERIWLNRDELHGAPGVDDDGNGFVDDVRGWDFVALDSAQMAVNGEDWRDEDADPNDFTGHGTAVAGLVGARTNNGIGVAGVAWDVRLMALRAGYAASLQPSGWVDLSAAARAIVYGAANGADVLNLSFASSGQHDLVAAADYASAAGVALVVAAGNGQPWHYLADRPDAIGVTATDSQDRLPTWANRGDYVALAAPGVGLPTTLLTRPGADSIGRRQPSYTIGATGTSFSAPIVAGAIALLQADRRGRGLRRLTPFELRTRLAETADDIAGQNPGETGFGGGRLNLEALLNQDEGSFAVRLPTTSVGPGVLVPMLLPPDRMAFAMSDGRLALAGVSESGLVHSVPLSGKPMGGLSAADLGGGLGPGLFVATWAGTIDGFDGNGRPLPGWPVAIQTGTWATPGEPALGDLDGDGRPEVVWGGSDGTVRAWHADGSIVAGFPQVLGGRYAEVRVALGDMDGSPGCEIAATIPTGEVHLLRGDGTSLPGWPLPGQVSAFAPVIARVGAPTRPCVVVAFQNLVAAYGANAAPAFQVLPGGYSTIPPVAGDLDGDGLDEIVLFRASPELVTVLDWYGRILWYWPPASDILPSAADQLRIGLREDGGASPVIAYRVANGSLFAHELDGTLLPDFPKTGGSGSPTILDVGDASARTWLASGTGPDTSLFMHVGWTPPATAARPHPWPAPRGNAARTACTFYAPPIGVTDNEPPLRVDDLAATATGTHHVRLAWTARAADAVRYDIRWSTQPLDELSFAAGQPVHGAPAPGAPSSPEQVEANGVAENATVYFAVRCLDAAGNPSAISNVAVVTTAGAAPGPVADLHVASWTDSSVTLRWTATGDDGRSGRPQRYRLHAAPAPIDEGNFASAPVSRELGCSSDAGGTEAATLQLARGTRWWIALVAEDASGLPSPLSNVISTVAGPLAARSGVALAPRARPSGVPVELWWQGAGTGAAAPREIRIHDLAGRLVRALPVGPGTEGVVSWDGRGADGARARAGLYFATVTAAGVTARTRIVIVQ